MCFKLALRNVRRSMKDFAVYFLTLTFGVCLFYLFNSIDSQQTMLDLSQTESKMVEMGTELLGLFSGFIAVVLGGLIVYANRFLMKRRHKEMGIYLLLGMRQRDISFILVAETLFVGIFSLIVGLIFGIVLSQGFASITAMIMDVRLKTFHFTLSVDAVLKSILYFGVIFLAVMLFNLLTVRRLKLIDLLYSGRKNEKPRLKSLWLSVMLFLASAVVLWGAYYCIIDNGMMQFDREFAAAIVLGCIGTVLFFLSLSGFLLRVIKSSKSLYYRGLNMFIMRQMNSRINTNFLSMSVISIMLLITIGTISSGFGFGNMYTQSVKEGAPYDQTISMYYTDNLETAMEQNGLSLTQDQRENSMMQTLLSAAGLDVSQYADQVQEIVYYVPLEKNSYTCFLETEGVEELVDNDFYMSYLQYQPMTFLRLSTYNHLRQMQGLEPVELSQGEYMINCNLPGLQEGYELAAEKGVKVAAFGKEFTPAKDCLQDLTLLNTMSADDGGTLIVNDSEITQYDQELTGYNLVFSYRSGVEDEDFQPAMEQAQTKLQGIQFSSLSQTELLEQANGLKLTIVYLMMYVGIVFLIASAAVLALQQLSDADSNKERYQLLMKLGAEERMLRKALYTQIGVYFLLPLALGLVHSAVGLYVVNGILIMFGYDEMGISILITAVLFVIIYGGYLAATCLGAQSMLKTKKQREAQ